MLTLTSASQKEKSKVRGSSNVLSCGLQLLLAAFIASNMLSRQSQKSHICGQEVIFSTAAAEPLTNLMLDRFVEGEKILES